MPRFLKLPENTHGTDYFVGDLHGCFEQLKERLKAVRFNPNRDRLISCGDLIDRGPESFKCAHLVKKDFFWGVRGNHEQMAIDALTEHGTRLDRSVLWIQNGGDWVLPYMASAKAPEVRERLLYLLGLLPVAIEVPYKGKTIGVVHADVPFSNWAEMKAREFNKTALGTMLWDRSRWKERGAPPVQNVDCVVVGHTPQKQGPSANENVLNIDTGAFLVDLAGREDQFCLTVLSAAELFEQLRTLA